MNVIKLQDDLQNKAKRLLLETPLLKLLSRLGEPVQVGSSVTGLMAYPDIDFTVQNKKPDFARAIALGPMFFSELSASIVKLADFSTDDKENASYYVGIEFPYMQQAWHIDATITKPGPIATNPPALQSWLNNMTAAQREIILRLKHELIDTGRYAGAGSQPPYTFRSAHLYEAVLVGGAKTTQEVEEYFYTFKNQVKKD